MKPHEPLAPPTRDRFALAVIYKVSRNRRGTQTHAFTLIVAGLAKCNNPDAGSTSPVNTRAQRQTEREREWNEPNNMERAEFNNQVRRVWEESQ